MLVWCLTAALAAAPFVEALERGERPRALRLARAALAENTSSSTERRAARLTEIVALVEMKRGAELTPSLDAAEREGIAFGVYGSHLRIAAATSAGECEAADALTRGLPESSVFRPVSWARVAQCAMRARNADLADAALDAYANESAAEWQSADALLLRARWHELAGDSAAARDNYREVQIHYPFSHASATAKTRLEDLAARGVPSPRVRGEELLPRAEAERARLNERRALRTYTRAIQTAKGDARLRYRALIGIAELEIIDYRYPRALNRLREVFEGTGDDRLRARALYLHGDVLSRRGQLEESLASYRRAVEEHPSAPHALESALAGARLAYSKRHFDEAKRFATWLYERGDPRGTGGGDETRIITEDGATRTSRGVHRDEAAWILAWIAKRSGQASDAADRWLAEVSDQSAVGLAARYWRARHALRRADLVAAAEHARALETRAPHHFYTFAAHDALCAAGGPCTVPTAPATSQPKAPPRDLAVFVTLFENGLEQTAHRLLRAVPHRALPPEDRAWYAWVHGRSGAHDVSTRVSRSLPPELLADPGTLAIGHPIVFEEVVRREAQRSGVPRELLLAVMREESGFEPKARSPRGARGLMQMIPRTARRMARSAGLSGFQLSQLFTPEISIRLGAHYLRQLLDEFDGDLAAAIASYHAGEKTVAQWKRRTAGLAPDEFIEEIPYSSTREYVKKVLGSYGTYRELYRGDGTRPILELVLSSDPPAPPPG